MAKVAISLSNELLESVDKYAKDNFQTRSGFIAMCCNNFLQAQQLQRVLGSMADSMAKMADAAEAGSIDEETLREVEQFEKLARMIAGAQIRKA